MTGQEIVALSKCDALDEETIAARSEELRKVARKKPMVISAVSGSGVKEVLFALAREIGRGVDQLGGGKIFPRPDVVRRADDVRPPISLADAAGRAVEIEIRAKAKAVGAVA